jgi:hypothetical protein
MQDSTPDSFNWPERPSSSDSTPEVKLEQASDHKAFYIPSSSVAAFPPKSPPNTATAPPARRHSSTNSQLRRSKQPYSITQHEARIRNKYGGEATRMSSPSYSHQWAKTDSGGCHFATASMLIPILMFYCRSRQAAGIRLRRIGCPGTRVP